MNEQLVSNLHGCQLCPRLAAYRENLKRQYPDYHCAPVAAMGNSSAKLLIVGLAPGLHGANASGRPFTGDASGDLLFATLFEYGFASQPQSRSLTDGMQLIDCRVTNAVKCLPPQNHPDPDEVNTCNAFLIDEISALPNAGALLALGGVAHRAVIKALKLRQADYPFAHAAHYNLQDGRQLFSSYHPSRYNLHTGKLTAACFAQVIKKIREAL
ncbi:uracil-DNA glycosylase [Gammaproteobacteria bacterium]|nr:uracil-DNA glycosylase [Gammaproteobacteria bacterium]